MPIQQTTALRKIASLRKPIRIIRGGQGSGKTISILILLINHAASKPDREILILSAELTKMRLTVIKDFVTLMKSIGIYEDQRFLAGTLYRFKNGSFIKFIGLDKDDVGKGLRSHVAYFNEINKCGRESFEQVYSRAGVVYADYNPDAEFYIDEDFIPREDACFLQLTYKDNELLGERERYNIEQYFRDGYNPDGTIKNAYAANKWQVYGLGNIGNLQGVVFENWEICDEVPETAKLVSYGLDFGYTNDPSAFGAMYKDGDYLIIDELFYSTGMLNSDIIAKLRELGLTSSQEIVADSAEPKSIEEIRRAGFKIKPAKKGADSINASIDLLQKHKIKVTKRSSNLIKELRAYRWKTDNNGKSLNEPVDRDNHAIDGMMRYPALNHLAAKRTVDIF
jgi:phage terminase large subunit